MKKSKTIREIPLGEILKGENYRKPQQIEQIAISLKSQGQLEPILAIKKPDGYMILNGYRRYHGMLYANENLKTNFDSIEAILVDEKLEEDDKALLQMVLNEFLDTPLEKAIKISELLDKGMTQQKIADAFGIERSYVSKVKKLIINDDIFLCYITGKTILRAHDKEKNKYHFGKSIDDFRDIYNENPDLMKSTVKFEPGEVKIKMFALEPISKAYELLKEKHIEIFYHLISALQHKKIYEKDKIEAMCNKAIKEVGINQEEKKSEKKGIAMTEYAKKVSLMMYKIKNYDDATIGMINRELEVAGVPVRVVKKD
jgi:ParB/RepB/Spo0J family partition protein